MEEETMGEGCDQERSEFCSPKPIPRQRRRELLTLADSIAARFEEVTDQRERRLVRRMVDHLITN